jgi:hypothetical protein
MIVYVYFLLAKPSYKFFVKTGHISLFSSPLLPHPVLPHLLLAGIKKI